VIWTPVQTGLDSSGALPSLPCPVRPAPHSDRPCLRAAVLLTSRLKLPTPPPYFCSCSSSCFCPLLRLNFLLLRIGRGELSIALSARNIQFYSIIPRCC